jgi:outer membrane protein assembly factor BamB
MPSPLIFATILAFTSPDDTHQWTGFRGPNGSGVHTGTTIPDKVDPESNRLWRREIPAGFSSPVIVGDAVFLTGYEDSVAYTLKMDIATGETQWKSEGPEPLPAPYRGPNSQVSSTPVTNGTHTYSFFRHFGVVCYDEKGDEVWRHKLAPFRVPHGMSSSPVIAGDKVIMQCDQDQESFIVALNRQTGEEAWKATRPRMTHSYSTPVVHKPVKGPAEVIVSGSFQVSAYDVETGTRSWWVDGMAWQAMTLPVIDNGVVFVHSHVGAMSEYGAPKMSGPFERQLEMRDKDGDGKISLEEWPGEAMKQLMFIYDLDGDNMLGPRDWEYAVRRDRETGGLFAIELGGQGNVSETRTKWSYKNRRGLPGIPSPLVYDGVLYLLKDGSLLTSMDPASGDVIKQERVGRSEGYYASPIAADGRILTAGESGLVTVVKAGREWEVVSSIDIEEDIWSTPALGGNRVVVRTTESLQCFGPK